MRVHIENFLKYKGLLKELVIRDIKIKYRRSFLGYIWSILNPLMMMLVISSVFSYIFRREIENFPVYLITGQVIYNFFSEATKLSMKSIIDGRALLKKIYFPRYIFPLARVFSSFVNLLFSLVAIIIILVITKTTVTPLIFLFPLPLIYVLLMSIGVGLILSVLTVFFRDMIYLYGIFLTALMYMTPIFYPVSSLPPIMIKLIKLNPLYHVISIFRDVIFYGTIPSLESNLACIGYSILFIGIGLIVFKKKQHKLILNV